MHVCTHTEDHTHTMQVKSTCAPAHTHAHTQTAEKDVGGDGRLKTKIMLQSSGAVWKSRWTSWAAPSLWPYGFCGHKETMKKSYSCAPKTVCSVALVFQFPSITFSGTFWQWLLKGTCPCKFGWKMIFGMNFYCFRYTFSAALISASALLKYANLRLIVVVLK